MWVVIWMLVAQASILDYTPCASDRILNIKDLSCSACPTNQRPNPEQTIPTECVCQVGYYADTNNTCREIIASVPCTGTDQFYDLYQKDGSSNSPPLGACSQCAANAYPNENKTGCIPCPHGMNYVDGQCTCIDNTQIETDIGCFDSSLTSALDLPSSNYEQQLKHVLKLSYLQLLPGCYHFKDYLSCSQIINLCAYSMGVSSAECDFFAEAGLESYLQVTDTSQYQMSSGNFNKDTELQLKILKYLPTGNFISSQTLHLTQLLRCGIPLDNSLTIKVGNNVEITCTYDFDHLASQIGLSSYNNYLYELFLKGDNDEFFQIPIYYNGGTTAYKRFFLEDTYTSDTSINVLTSFSLVVNMNTEGALTTPSMSVGYTQLTMQSGAIASGQDEQELTFAISFKYDLTNFWSAFIPIIAVVSVLALVQAIIRTYIGYLNRESPFTFFYYFAKIWSLWNFYFLLIISGYWFLFTKVSQQLYIFIPASDDNFYIAFYVLATLMFLFRIITVIADKAAKLNYEVFLINWEKGTFKNSWREIFIVNSLAEFYTYRTVSVFWMLLCTMFFMVGFRWDYNAAEVTHTTIDQITSINPKNRVLMYFLGSAVFLAVGIVFKILRRISVFRWPYPFEDFVDYCAITNISFFFMKKKSPEAFYIHASSQDRTEVTAQEVNQVIHKALTKVRKVESQMSFSEGSQLRMYNVYACKDLEDKFNNMLKKLEDQQHGDQINQSQQQLKMGKKNNIREEFIERKLKPYLDVIGREGSNRSKSVTESMFGFPPIDLRDPDSIRNNLVIFDEKYEIVSEVFPNGNQFEQIHTVIIIFLIFNLLFNSTPVAALFTYFIDAYLINAWIGSRCRANLEKMTKVKEGFML